MIMDYRLLAAISCLALIACTGNESVDPRYDSGSHWLTACEADSECGSLQCECGFCTYPCTGTAQCPDGLCFNPRTAASCESVEFAICGVLCDDSTGCGAGSACLEGVCVRAESSSPDVGSDIVADGPDVSDTGADLADADTDDTGEDAVSVDADADSPDAFELCEEIECGEMLTVASWRCPDGSAAGEMCVRVSEALCEWTIRECPQEVLSCYGAGDCPEEMECNAAEVCLSDPECPECDVCFGWCVDPEDACSAEECGPTPAAAHYRCDDSSLAGPICERDEERVCGWRERSCQ